ncbi:MAG: hypothetical protein GWN58_42650, partial [Anaerolineae bacterium]|nr:hypothetical protein [Anaerolineae bacterium]
MFADEDEEPGVSGATLAFRHVWQVIHMTARCHEDPYLKVERFAELAGIRDTWQTEDSAWDEACAQAEALMFWGLENWIGC